MINCIIIVQCFYRKIGGKIIEGYLKVNGDEVYMHYKGENSYGTI